MRKTTIHSILLAILSLWTGISASAANEFKTEDGLRYKILSKEDRTIEVIKDSKYEDFSGDLYIPQKVIHNSETYTVISIGEDAFLSCRNITSISLPNSLTSIGNRAFLWCEGITSISLPKSLTSIGHGAFSGCFGLTSLTLPNSPISIEYDTFKGCSRLTSLTIPNSVTYISPSAFINCYRLKNINVEAENTVYSSVDGLLYNKDATKLILFPQGKSSIPKLPETLTSIGDYAFYQYSKLTSLTLPNSLTSIGDHAFEYCSGLTSLTLPNSLTSIGGSAFGGCI